MLVWIVFYWVICGLQAIVGGVVLQFASNLGAGMAQGMSELTGPQSAAGARVVATIIEFFGLLYFHVGLVTLVVCHGLWSFRKWGLFHARWLSVLFAAVSLLAFVGALLVGVGIVFSLANLLVSIGIIVYLFGSTQLSERVKGYYARLRSQGTSQDWTEFT